MDRLYSGVYEETAQCEHFLATRMCSVIKHASEMNSDRRIHDLVHIKIVHQVSLSQIPIIINNYNKKHRSKIECNLFYR